MPSDEQTQPSSGATPTRPPRARRRGITALAVIALLITVLLAVLSLGAIFPRIPTLGVAGSFVIPTVAPWAFVLAVAGTVLAILARRANRRRLTTTAMIAGLLSVLGTGTVFGTHLVLAARAGAHIGPSMFSMQLASDGAPDTTQTYFTDATGALLHMDVYRPSGSSATGAAAPILVYIHGGGWNTGETTEIAATLRWFADQGYLVLAPEYTLAAPGRPTWNVAAPQVGCALIWAGQNAASVGGDPSRLAVFGGSAGGNLALTTTYAAAAGKLTPACEGTVPKVSAVVGAVPAVDPAYVDNVPDPLMKGYTQALIKDFLGGTPDEHPDRLAAVQVRTYLTPDAPPTFISANIGDHIVPVEGTRQLEREAHTAGVDITARYVPFSDHPTLSVNNGLTAEMLRAQILDFIHAHGV